jgi:hypothetical protein
MRPQRDSSKLTPFQAWCTNRVMPLPRSRAVPSPARGSSAPSATSTYKEWPKRGGVTTAKA